MSRTRVHYGWSLLPALLVALGLSACGDAQARGLEDQLEEGHEAAYYIQKLEEMGYEVSATKRADDEVALRAENGEGAYAVRLRKEDGTATVSSVKVEADHGEPEVEALPVAVTLSAGTSIPVTLDRQLSSQEAQVGQTFTLTVREDVRADGEVAIPRGATIEGRVQEVQRAERPEQGGALVLTPTRLEVRGQSVDLDGHITAQGQEMEGEGSHKEDWKKIAAGAGLGGIIGGVTKGGTGALAGVLIGGGGTFLATRGEVVTLPAGAPLTVEITESRRVPLM